MTDEIPTETRERTHVETSIEETTEEYEVTTCEWCEGEHPVEQTVPVAINPVETTTSREVATVEVQHGPMVDGVWHIETADCGSFSRRDVPNRGSMPHSTKRTEHTLYAETPELTADHTIPFCGYCANAVFDVAVDVPDEMDEPAADAYADFDFGQPVADTGDADESTGVDDPDDWAYLSLVAFFTAIALDLPTAVVGGSALVCLLSQSSVGPFGLVKRVLTAEWFWLLVMLGSLVTMVAGPLAAPGIPTVGWAMVALVQCILGGLLAEKFHFSD